MAEFGRPTNPDLTNQTVELLQTLIRNECVNDGTPESGQEVRNSDVLQTLLEGSGLDVETFEPTPGRKSLVARIEGSNPDAPSVCWMGHTDVVPVNPQGWSRDPFGGELIDGEVWGRGAVDMLNLTSSMAVAFRHLADTNFQPEGDLIYFAVADEESGSAHGARWFGDHNWDPVECDYLLTEMGGTHLVSDRGRAVLCTVGEKGVSWRRIKISGTPGHGSMPFGADNALIKAAEVVRRLGEYLPNPQLDEMWGGFVGRLGLPENVERDLTDPSKVQDTIASMPANQARFLHSCTHTTFSPNVLHGGIKTNVIPDDVSLEVDIRTLPGETSADVEAHLRAALGDMSDEVEVEVIHEDDATSSPTNTAMWDTLGELVQRPYPGAELLPHVLVGFTDSRVFRQKGSIAYGAGLFSHSVSMADISSRFHGHDERIDVDSLGLSVDLWLGVAERFWHHAAS